MRSRYLSISRRVHGFTLIELLVVISIISLLVAILLPALAGARQAAVSIECLTRFRAFGQYVEIYRSDWNDYYPVSSTDGMHHMTQLGPYIDPGQADYSNSAGIWNASNTAKVNRYLCPTSGYEPGNSSSFIYANYASISSWRVHNYHMSVYFGWHNLTTYPEGSSRRGFNVPASRHAMMGEIYGSNTRWPRFDLRWVERSSLFRHPGESTNILFRDGHASNVGNFANIQANYKKSIDFDPTEWW